MDFQIILSNSPKPLLYTVNNDNNFQSITNIPFRLCLMNSRQDVATNFHLNYLVGFLVILAGILRNFNRLNCTAKVPWCSKLINTVCCFLNY